MIERDHDTICTRQEWNEGNTLASKFELSLYKFWNVLSFLCVPKGSQIKAAYLSLQEFISPNVECPIVYLILIVASVIINVP